METKITGRRLATFRGLTIYGRVDRPKRRGKVRLWLHVRQARPKRWRTSITLSYTKALDVCFEEEE